MLNGFNVLKLAFLSTLILRIQMPVIVSFFITRVFFSRCTAHVQSNWLWRDLFQTVGSRENYKKSLKDSQVWEKNVLLKKSNPLVFLIPFSVFFEKKETSFCSFFKKAQKLHSFFFFFQKSTKTPYKLFLLHYAISSFAETHNNKLWWLLWHSNLRVKKGTSTLFSQRVVGQFAPVVKLSKKAHSK